MCCMIFCTVLIVLQSSQISCPVEPYMPDSYWQFMLGDVDKTEECVAWTNAEWTKEKYISTKFGEGKNPISFCQVSLSGSKTRP